jgi:hypothetical protein
MEMATVVLTLEHIVDLPESFLPLALLPEKCTSLSMYVAGQLRATGIDHCCGERPRYRVADAGGYACCSQAFAAHGHAFSTDGRLDTVGSNVSSVA